MILESRTVQGIGEQITQYYGHAWIFSLMINDPVVMLNSMIYDPIVIHYIAGSDVEYDEPL